MSEKRIAAKRKASPEIRNDPPQQLTEYERQRMANVQKNQKVMQSLGIDSATKKSSLLSKKSGRGFKARRASKDGDCTSSSSSSSEPDLNTGRVSAAAAPARKESAAKIASSRTDLPKRATAVQLKASVGQKERDDVGENEHDEARKTLARKNTTRPVGIAGAGLFR